MRKLVVFAGAFVFMQVALLALGLSQQRTWGGFAEDKADEVAVAPDGSTYVVGTTESFGVGDRDAFLLKYTPQGSLAWQRTYGTARIQPFLRADEFGLGVAAAVDGSAYITGQFGDGTIFLAKFDAVGNLEWQITWGQNGDFARGVEVAGDGSVYVAGGTFARGAGQRDALLLKFTAQGDFVWARTLGGQFDDAANDIAIGSDGGIYIAGEMTTFLGNDAFLAKFTADGSVAWAREWGIAGGTALTSAFGVGSGPDGTVYFTGNAVGTGVDESLILVKFDAAGSLMWERLSGPSFATGLDVAVAADGTVYVVGNTADDFNSSDAVVIKFLASGRAREASRWGGVEQENATSVAVASDGSIVIGGEANAPPYTFRRAQHRTRQPNAFVATPDITITLPTDAVGTPLGLVTSPNGSVTFGGAIDAAFLRLVP